MIPYRDLCRYAALADVSLRTMKLVLDGAPITNRARARAKGWLERNRLTHLIAVPHVATTQPLMERLAKKAQDRQS